MQIYSEALKILRLENHSRLLQKKENKIIEKEITKIKQILENHRTLIRKEMDKTTHREIKSSLFLPKFSKYSKLPKRLENYYDTHFKINDFLNHHVHIIAEAKNTQQKVSINVKTLLIKHEKTEKALETVCNHNRSITEYHIENDKHILEVLDGNSKTMKTVFEKNTSELKHKSLIDVKKKFKIRNNLEMQNNINQKILEKAWKTWKAYAQQLKNRRREKTIYTNKIESFLSYLQEKQTGQKKTKHLGLEMRLKHEIKIYLALENQVKTREKQIIREQKEEKLKKLMQEVKTSQIYAKNKLQEITESNFKNKEKLSNHKFLHNVEKRRQERLKRRKEIQEKKLQLKEEKEKVQIKREEERRQKEKQIRLEELKRKQRLEKEKKLQQKQKREELRLNRKLAENHYEIYLLRVYGWRPWTALLNVRDLEYQKAVAFYEKRTTQKIFCRWMTFVKEHVEVITLHAENFYKSSLKKKILIIWKKFLEGKRNQGYVAVDWNEFKITERAFKKWLQFTQHEILEYLHKKETVKLFYERKLKMKSLKKIMVYPKFRKMEQAREIRKQIWREKVKEILPDYQPINVSE